MPCLDERFPYLHSKANMITFKRILFEEMNWSLPAAMGKMNIFQTRAWLSFLAERQPLEPVLAAIYENGELQGFFTGLIAEKFGLRILGSPFRGWTTYFMGFNLKPGAPLRLVLQALPEFAFHELECQYLELIDPFITEADCCGLKYVLEPLPWYALDLRPSEETLFANMKHACRTNIRKACNNGLRIETACEPGFADEYYAQYVEVMQRHALQPAFGLQTVRLMIKHVLPTGCLLLLRARLPGGESIATGLFLSLGRMGVFWGAASCSEYQHFRPNEYLAWQAVKHLKAQGVEILHFGGYAGQYKEKFGCREAHILRLRLASSTVLGSLINFAAAPRNERYRNWILKNL